MVNEALGLTDMGEEVLTDSRLGSSKQHQLVPLLRQSIYSRLAGYEDVSDAQTRLQLFPLAYSLANFLWRLTVPKSIRQWTGTTLREKLIKIRVKVTRHSEYVTFQLAEVAVTRRLFAAILARIEQLAIPLPLVAGADA